MENLLQTLYKTQGNTCPRVGTRFWNKITQLSTLYCTTEETWITSIFLGYMEETKKLPPINVFISDRSSRFLIEADTIPQYDEEVQNLFSFMGM